MRIVLPIHSFQPGGVERVAMRLAASWQANGADVTVVLGRDEGPARLDEASGSRWRIYRSYVPTAQFETIWMIVCLYRYLRREQEDVLFCPGNTYTIVCAAMRLLLGRNCPPIVAKISNDLHRADLPAPIRPFYKAWVRAHAFFVDRFVALAAPMAPEIVEQVRVDGSRVVVIPDPALTAAEFARLCTIERRAHLGRGAAIIAIGRLVAQKNFALLLQAFAVDAEMGDTLLIAGEGPELPRLRRLAQDLRITDKVTFAGHSHDIPALLERADIFALSSDYEGVPAAIIEALAAGLPIVATRCSGSIEWLTGFGSDGIVVPTRDAEQLARALKDIRDRAIPSAEGRRRTARFTLEQASNSYLELFASVVKSKGRCR